MQGHTHSHNVQLYANTCITHTHLLHTQWHLCIHAWTHEHTHTDHIHAYTPHAWFNDPTRWSLYYTYSHAVNLMV